MEQYLTFIKTLGLEMPDMFYVAGVIIFGIVGFFAYRRAKKSKNKKARYLSLALMFYPYVVDNTVLLYVVGCGLCGAIWYVCRYFDDNELDIL